MNSNHSLLCFYCNKRINGRYYFDWAGHNICASHISHVKKCASCGQFCDSKSKDIGLGMKICAHCLKYRIERKDSDAIIKFIKQIYQSTEIGVVTGWSLKMVDAETLYKMTHDMNTRGLARAEGNKYTIFIYRELSRVAFAQVLAHEMLHVYQYTHGFHPIKPKCEGFCNLGSFVILSAINNSEAKAAIENLKRNEDPIYGNGFRAMLSVYESSGWHAAIKQIKGF